MANQSLVSILIASIGPDLLALEACDELAVLRGAAFLAGVFLAVAVDMISPVLSVRRNAVATLLGKPCSRALNCRRLVLLG